MCVSVCGCVCLYVLYVCGVLVRAGGGGVLPHRGHLPQFSIIN